jgi:hypothetical protein
MSRVRARIYAHVLVSGLLALALASPGEAGLRNRFEIGSILIEVTQGNPAAIVGLAASANQGLEKTISYSLPRLSAADTTVTVPLFLLNADIDDNGNHAVARGIDTLLFLTNSNPPAGASVAVQITFRSGSGAALNSPVAQSIAPGQTVVISAISTLNP